MFINLARFYEEGIKFRPGKVNTTDSVAEVGYLCYAYEGERRVLFTPVSYAMNLSNDITVFVIILISSGISFIAFKKEVHAMNKSPEMKRDELKRFRFNFIARLKERKLGAIIFCICLCYVFLRLPLTIIGNESIPYWKLKFAIFMFLYNLQFTFHSVVYPIGGKEFRYCYLDMLKKIFPCCFKCLSTSSMHMSLNITPSY